jgi:hypothetical protein
MKKTRNPKTEAEVFSEPVRFLHLSWDFELWISFGFLTFGFEGFEKVA